MILKVNTLVEIDIDSENDRLCSAACYHADRDYFKCNLFRRILNEHEIKEQRTFRCEDCLVATHNGLI